MAFSISGLGSGLDIDSLVSQLVSIERLGQKRLEASKTDLGRTRTAWADLRTKLESLATLAQGLTTPAGVERVKATSSAPTLVGVTTTSLAQPTSFTLQVSRLATAQTLASAGLASPDALVGVGQVDLGTGTEATGLTLSGGSGARSAVVTRASSAAVVVGTTAPALTYTGGGRNLSVSVDGVASNLRLANSYASAGELVTDLNTQLPPGVTASLSDTGALQLTRTVEGSTSTLQIGGPAAAALGLSTDIVAGVDGAVRVGSGPEVTLAGGASTTFDGVTATAGAALRTGTVVATDAGTTLTQLAEALSANGSPVTASVVDTGAATDPYRLVLTSRTTGTDGAVQLRGTPPPGFPPLTEVQAAADAEFTYDGLTITRSTNTVSDLVPGVTLNLVSAEPGTPVTITIAADDPAVTTAVKELVAGINAVVRGVNDGTKHVEGSTTRPALAGTGARDLSSQLWSAVGSNADLGLKIERDGTYTLDETAFAAALTKDRAGTLQRVADLGTRLDEYATAQTSDTGRVARGLKSLDGTERSLTSRIDAYDVRLRLVEDRYRRQFTAMETAIAGLRSQSDWLAGQLGNLLVPGR